MEIEVKPIHCIYKSPREACRSTRQQWESAGEGKKLHILPYNRFKPEQSRIWWLSPSSANPAYKHGKFAFLAGKSGTMEVGLYVEKGLGEEYCSVDHTKAARTMVLDRDWTWHAVIRDMASGKIGVAREAVSTRSESTVEVFVEGGYATPGFAVERHDNSPLWRG